MELARATGTDLATATLQVGKAFQGNGGKLLKTLGINAKTISGQKALNAILAKTKGSAAAYADTLEGSFSVVSIQAAELKEQFGAAFLPAVTRLFKGLAPYMDKFANTIKAYTPQIQRFADVLVTKILERLPKLFEDFKRLVPQGIKSLEGFIDKISSIGKGADSLLGPGGSITLLVTGIGAAFGGLKGAITANLLKDGMDPFTALVVANILAQIPLALASAITSQIVAGAVTKFGIGMAAASTGSAAAGAALAGGAGAVAGFGGAAIAGAAALPFGLALGLKAAGVTQIAQSGLTPAMIAAAQAGTTNNIFIGTGKVDTVITNSLNRTGTGKRGR
jgi:hypothetical protein